MSNPPGSPNSPGAINKSRLSEMEKRDNHIKSEKKRREAIRQGFDRLARIVPGMEGQGRSEAIVLQATVNYMKEKIAEKERLRQMALEKGYSMQDFEQIYREAEKQVRIEDEERENGETPSASPWLRQT
ncbi:bHLH domain-containing [Lecanosticta acicola]|uniref:BHLH domain-containing n=1 Tax=Lecanosticta acicola TaxID=111012 RepID=A0AAI8W154_9PEZI|nr:bHLH domain-containing [Lecanosticta acicola]